MFKTNDVVTREQIEAEGFEYYVSFGSCLVFVNKTTRLFWHPESGVIKSILTRRDF